MSKATIAFVELADACGYAFAVMPSAKGMVPEQNSISLERIGEL